MPQRSSRNELEFIFKYCFRTSHGPRLKMLVSKTGTTINISLFVAQEVVFLPYADDAIMFISERRQSYRLKCLHHLPANSHSCTCEDANSDVQRFNTAGGKKDRRAEGKRRGTDTCIIQMQIICLNQDAERTCAVQRANTVTNYINYIIY